MYKGETWQQAANLRQQGRSLKEIAEELGIAKSTASLWARGIKVSPAAQAELRARVVQAQKSAAERTQTRRRAAYEQLKFQTGAALGRVPESTAVFELCAALLYWCEGGKHEKSVVFTNSDPVLVRTFMNLLRRAFVLDERKFRVCIHLHEYHDKIKQKNFWSQVTGIPSGQFMKSYCKPHTGKNQRPGYPGCVAIKYYDVQIFKRLKAMWETFGEKYGRVV